MHSINYEAYFRTFCNWLKLEHNEKALQKFFDDNYIRTIAIYGMGELGKLIYNKLQLLDINILYVIDRNAEKIDIKNIKIIHPDQKLEKVDAIIVTPLHLFYEIEKMLYEKGVNNIISLEDVVGYCI